MEAPTLLYLSRADVESLAVPMSRVLGALEEAFREKGEGRVERPPKPGIHTRPDAFIHAMPAYIPALSSAGLKWVSGYPENQARGLPYITGLLVLNDPNTGFPLAVMDCTWITAQRTGAATALAAKYLARPESSTLGILACGVQGRSNLEALSCVFGLERVKAYDIVPEVARQYAKDMSERVGGPILKDPSPVIEADWLAEGAFASPVDFDSYWQGAALRQIDKLATDDHAQLAYYRGLGYFSETPAPYADLGELVCGLHPGREDPGERTMSINLGLALEDMATAPLILAEAERQNVGTRLPL